MNGQSMSALPATSDVDLFRYRERIVDLHAQIADRTPDFRVAERSCAIMRILLSH